jgi:hypothetical protein
MFSICGARSDLSPMPDGPPVDYDSTSLAGDVIVLQVKFQMYGVAAYNCWRSRQGDEVHGVMKSYRREHYADIPVPRPPSNNVDDLDYALPTSLQRRYYIYCTRGQRVRGDVLRGL